MTFVKTVHVINWTVLNPRIFSALRDETVQLHSAAAVHVSFLFVTRQKSWLGNVVVWC